MTESTDSPPRYSPLHAVHVAAGATFTDFAGWQMPVRYSSDLAEHHAVRSAAGLFDLSHMAEFEVSGAEAGAFLDHALAGRLSAIELGQAKYSLLLAPEGGIIDDLVVYRTGDSDFLVVANASNHDPVAAALADRIDGFDAMLRDTSDETALIAVQGPGSRAILEATAGFEAPGLDELRYYRAIEGTFRGERVLVARTGYTGEDGFELYVHPDLAEAVWTAVAEAGADKGIVPAGLASRDTLRLEAGMPLYGHELSLETFPVQAGLGRVPAMAKAAFVGREALEQGPATDAPVLVGLVADGRRAARADYAIYAEAADDAATEPIGVVTSGALSPTLGHPIAMAYVAPRFAEPDTELSVDIRGTRLTFRTTTLPFYRRKKD
ncbi:glycine cleavage system aminomethyltransferase GcvT [Herbiconiux sp. CPCC 205763]|uniref:Aminomethyltransferase n=1 Tax=Herbiconiux aconitum TaxID=2970913 RepID=A0ABT2GS49_9MICO|nr:glycine cleavage system aminomethyltransferase GcvT [Herbiconiux aconitum]MCS5719053.1 glycine cleavage system aminomethyltransferase GcvT [Herbiconiux aconitum]